MYTIRRIGQINDGVRNYKVFINNKYYCSLKPNEEIELNLIERDVIQIKIDWCTSNVYTVNKNFGNLKVSSNISDNFLKFFIVAILVSIFLAVLFSNIIYSFIFFIPLIYILYKITFGYSNYLKIEEVE